MFESRKKLLLDRGPSWPDYHKAKPFMVRYYLLFRKRPKWFPFNIFLHKIRIDKKLKVNHKTSIAWWPRGVGGLSSLPFGYFRTCFSCVL